MSLKVCGIDEHRKQENPPISLHKQKATADIANKLDQHCSEEREQETYGQVNNRLSLLTLQIVFVSLEDPCIPSAKIDCNLPISNANI